MPKTGVPAVGLWALESSTDVKDEGDTDAASVRKRRASAGWIRGRRRRRRALVPCTCRPRVSSFKCERINGRTDLLCRFKQRFSRDGGSSHDQ